MSKSTAILLISCPDQRGIVARLSGFVFERGGNIVDSDHHSDLQAGRFLGRIEWEDESSPEERAQLRRDLEVVAGPMGGSWQLHFSDVVPRIAIWCSRQGHCLLDLVWRHQAGELGAELAFVLSNHELLRRHVEPLARRRQRTDRRVRRVRVPRMRPRSDDRAAGGGAHVPPMHGAPVHTVGPRMRTRGGGAGVRRRFYSGVGRSRAIAGLVNHPRGLGVGARALCIRHTWRARLASVVFHRAVLISSPCPPSCTSNQEIDCSSAMMLQW